ncbi:dachshund homolog 1-like isoform X1 [Mizuhopecten yessoensis]|uniref:Dachshund-like 1 n=1 Tax=Mizuhopecten yessoensis TaxID=6573 RepID=A0A210PJ37_MIZYE|nr:dachshund homolog 1-like isoform X1 [Mizuhopecten yessoensis]OWF36508.1 Dachshund-like 1 [Mizuhopecten yessoensis]
MHTIGSDYMESPLGHLKGDPYPSPPRAHSSPGPTPGTISLTHGMIPTVNHNNSLLSKLHKATTYSSPPPIACNPDNNICKLIEYRSAKVAAFVVDGRELICLPQAFELFLKHLVGGLHTVYTKLKRLDILPVVCNVEQVRILRGLGSIQPGVNRCKLISCKEFDILYEDCTNSNARPGRPPKRNPHLHASPETLEKLKKSRLDGDHFQYDPRLYGLSNLLTDRKSLFNGFAHHPYAMGPLPFMPLNHPMISPPTSIAMATHLGLRPDGSIIKDRSSSESDLMSPRSRDERLEAAMKMGRVSPHYDAERLHRNSEYDNNKPLNLHINGHTKDLSNRFSNGKSDDDDDEDDRLSDERDDDLDDSMDPSESGNNSDIGEKHTAPAAPFPTELLNGETPSISSIETLLLNIQGLLKVAAENARHHERQLSYEKAELKMELIREKEVRESLEKQLSAEQRSKVALLKRIKREKRIRRKIQEQQMMEISLEQQAKASHSPHTASVPSPDSVKNNNESASEKEVEKEMQSEAIERRMSCNSESQERSSHLFENYLSHSSNSTNRFPYLPMVKDVQ